MSQAQVRRKQIVDLLTRTRMDQFGPSDHQPLKAVVEELNQSSAGLGSEKTGIHFSLAEKTTGRPPKIDPNTGMPFKSPDSSFAGINFVTISMARPLTNVTLADALDAIVVTADKPIEYWITEKGVFFALGNGPEAPRLYSRIFKLDTDAFLANLRKPDSSKTNVTTFVRQLCYQPVRSFHHRSRFSITIEWASCLSVPLKRIWMRWKKFSRRCIAFRRKSTSRPDLSRCLRLLPPMCIWEVLMLRAFFPLAMISHRPHEIHSISPNS